MRIGKYQNSFLSAAWLQDFCVLTFWTFSVFTRSYNSICILFLVYSPSEYFESVQLIRSTVLGLPIYLRENYH